MQVVIEGIVTLLAITVAQYNIPGRSTKLKFVVFFSFFVLGIRNILHQQL